ncbi:MAG: hypothetical protein HC881_01245 [Leptolyngbyaceae cyanobacterium SL_7_1]|nr:hypothetical protein [Leptolyngbyaceae cyanobacterium SL_7_1]
MGVPCWVGVRRHHQNLNWEVPLLQFPLPLAQWQHQRSQSNTAAVPATTGTPQSPVIATTPATPAGTLPPDLIPSNDANQRVRGVQRNRPDPFALVPTIASIEIPEQTSAPARIAPAAPGSYNPPVPPGAVSFNPPRVNSPQSGTSGGQGPGQLAPIPDLVPTTPVPPPPPQPTTARAVQVSGIVQIGNVPYAIVKAPNEPTSRYVRVGQSLSDGEVLVKRIVANQGAEPFVVLEQFGIEVVRSVGEGGVPSAASPDSPALPTG